MKFLSILGAVFVLVGAVACFKSKEKPWVPLALESGVKPQVVTLTEQGRRPTKRGSSTTRRIIFPKR